MPHYCIDTYTTKRLPVYGMPRGRFKGASFAHHGPIADDFALFVKSAQSDLLVREDAWFSPARMGETALSP